MLLAFPWLFVSFILYNVVVFTSANPLAPLEILGKEAVAFHMVSGGRWSISAGDILVALTLVLLFVEIVKATRTTSTSIVDHGVSLVLFILCLIEFIVRPEAATSVFFFITLAALIDVVAGFTVTIRAAKRDLAIGSGT